MQFFAAKKLALFASQLLGAAGLDLTALAAAGDIQALKNAMSASAGLAETKALLATAQQDLQTLSVGFDALEARHAHLLSAFSKAGVKLPEFAETATAGEIETSVAESVKTRASVLAAEQLAAAGHPPVTETASDVTKAAPAKPALRGMDLVRASIAAGFARLNSK